MSTSKLMTIGGGLLVIGVSLGHLTCAGVPLTAPSGSTLTLNANPTFIPANGGISAITAIVVEPAGTFVPNGTVVFFITNLGRIDAQGKTKDGFVHVNFVSDSRSGTATITAFSGGDAPGPAPSTTPTPGFSTTAVPAGAAISQQVKVDIGSALPADVIVTASPTRITEPRNTEITANVYDANGNPVSHVPVIFKVEGVSGGNQLVQEELDSGSQPRYTDTNGQARDILRTRQNRADAQKRVEVSATVPGTAQSPSIFIFIN